MSKFATQFHALPEELCAFVKQCVTDFDLHIVAMKFFPFEATEVSPKKLDDVFSISAPYQELGLTTDKPSLPAKSNTEFFDKNPNKLRVDIQRITDEGLRQTWLTTSAQDAQTFKTWQKIANRLKKITKAGVAVINPDSAVYNTALKFRYTEGAKLSERRGVTMLPFAGSCIMRLRLKEKSDKE